MFFCYLIMHILLCMTFYDTQDCYFYFNINFIVLKILLKCYSLRYYDKIIKQYKILFSIQLFLYDSSNINFSFKT